MSLEDLPETTVRRVDRPSSHRDKVTRAEELRLQLADEIVRRGITDRISPRHASRLLKSSRPAAAPLPVMAYPSPRRRPRHEDR